MEHGSELVRLSVEVRDLTMDDIAWIGWAGGPEHPRYVAEALARVASGEVDYLAVCGPAGLPLSVGGIDYQVNPGGGTLWQLATLPAMRSCGLGTLLVTAAEGRISSRGLRTASLGFEVDNPRAGALYERLGYVAYGSEQASWETRNAEGQLITYVTTCTQMRKSL